jgi:WD40 repeat protein
MVKLENENIIKFIFSKFCLLHIYELFKKMHNTILNFAALRTYSYKTAYGSIVYKKTLIGNSHHLNSISLLPNGNIISIEKGAKTIIIWNAKDFSVIAKVKNSYPIDSLIVIPNGNVITNSDTEFKTWDTNNGFKCVVKTSKIEGYERLVGHILLSNGYLAYAAGDWENCYILIIDYNNDDFKCIKKIDEYNYWTTAIVNLPNERFVSGHDNGSIYFWSITKGYKCMRTNANQGLVTALHCIDERKLLLSGHGYWKGIVKVWNIESYLCVKGFNTEGSINGFLFLPFCYFALLNSKSIKIKYFNNRNDSGYESYDCINSFEDHSSFKSALLLKNNKIALVLGDGRVLVGLLN